MKFHLADMRGDALDLKFARSVSELEELLGLDDVHAAEPGLEVDLGIQRVQETLVIQGRATGRVETTCVRCLNPLTVDVSADVEAVLFPRPDQIVYEEDVELSADELDMAYYDGPEIDLSDIIREAVLLEVPGYPAHDDDDEACQPLLDEYAAEADSDKIDPRWAKLASMKLNGGKAN